MLSLFSVAFLFGLLFNAAPGAVTAESLRRGLRGGFRDALAVQLGSLVGDGLWVVLGLYGAAVLISIPAVQMPLAAAGAMLMFWLAYDSLKSALSQVPEMHSQQGNHKGALYTGVALSVSNPLNITYWAALGGTIASLSGETPTTLHFVVFVGGFMASSTLWCFVAAGAIAMARRRLSQGLWTSLNAVCGLGMIALGLVVCKDLLI